MNGKLQNDVTELISNSTGQLRADVVKSLVEVVLLERKKLVIDSHTCLMELNKVISKIRPDQVSFNAQGEKVNETYSKNKFEERKKLLELSQKLEQAIEKVLTKTPVSQDDFDQLKKAFDAAKNRSSAKTTDEE